MKLATTVLLLTIIITLSGHSQTLKSKYNSELRITEYYNDNGEMVQFSRINTKRKRIEYYSTNGELLKTKVYEVKEKNFIPKSKLSSEDLKLILPHQYENIEGIKVIRVGRPNLEILDYYALDGKYYGIKKYNRGTEEWEFSPEK